MVVDIKHVIDGRQASQRDVWKMADVLRRQGQIEPLQVKPYAPEVWITFDEDPWGAAIVGAAQMLEWPTLLIVEVKRYQP